MPNSSAPETHVLQKARPGARKRKRTYDVLGYPLTFILLLFLLASCQQDPNPRPYGPWDDPQVRKAADEVMKDMEAMSWFAPALSALRTAIAKHKLATATWPREFGDLKQARIPYTYPSEGSNTSDFLDARNSSFKFIGERDGMAVYDIVLRGVEVSGQEFDIKELSEHPELYDR